MTARVWPEPSFGMEKIDGLGVMKQQRKKKCVYAQKSCAQVLGGAEVCVR